MQGAELEAESSVDPVQPKPAESPLENFHAESDLFGILSIPRIWLGLTSIPVVSLGIGWHRRDPAIFGDHLEFAVLSADFLRELQRIFRINEQHHAAAVAEYDFEMLIFVGVVSHCYTR